MAALTGSRDFVTGSDQRALTAPTCLSQILLDKYSQDKYWTHTGQIRNRTNWENTQQEHHSSTKTRNTSKVTNTQIHNTHIYTLIQFPKAFSTPLLICQNWPIGPKVKFNLYNLVWKEMKLSAGQMSYLWFKIDPEQFFCGQNTWRRNSCTSGSSRDQRGEKHKKMVPMQVRVECRLHTVGGLAL